MTHLDDDALVLLHYEGGPPEAAAHVGACAECRERFAALQDLLGSIPEPLVPERPADYGATVWARVASRLDAPVQTPSRLATAVPHVTASAVLRGPWARPWRQVAGLSALAASLVVAFLLGRQFPGPTATGLTPAVRERVLLIAIGDHLERSQMVLVELATAPVDSPLDVSLERASANDLVSANRLYRQTAARAGEPALAAMLEELERVLVEVAAGPERLSPEALGELQRRIESRGLLFKIRVLGSQVREREKAQAPSAARALHETRNGMMTVGILFAALALGAVPEPEALILPGDDQVEARDASVRAQEDAARQQARTAREDEQGAREAERKARDDSRKDREDERYERGTAALDEGAWDQAIDAFDSVIEAKSRRADGALYWKAYATNKLGRREEALKLLAELGRDYPQSRWLKEARALDAEVRQQAGQPARPENVADEDLKLMAINGLLNTDAERAIPMLEKLLQGPSSRKLQERALFVLTQSNSPRAREIVVRIAKGDGQPDLQRKAIQQLGIFGGKESRQALVEIYAASTDRSVKQAVLQAFMVAGEKDRVLEAARSEKDPDLRRDAIQTLGVMGAQAELWAMYQAETVPATKKAILQAMAVGGAIDRILEVARTEKDPELRRDAIQKLGIFGGKRGADAVVEIYKTETDRLVRGAALQALFVQGNAPALIEVARTEKDIELKKRAVAHLSTMGSKEATEYLIEILNK